MPTDHTEPLFEMFTIEANKSYIQQMPKETFQNAY